MKGEFHGGETLVEKIDQKIKRFKGKIDEHHIMVFYYKIASLYFGDGNNKKCIVYWRVFENSKVVVAANFDNNDQVIDIEFPNNGVWYDFLNGTDLFSSLKAPHFCMFWAKFASSYLPGLHAES